MASYQFVNRPNQVRDSFSSEVRHGRSKAQMCLRKILDFISSHASSVRPRETPKESSSNPRFSELEAESEEYKPLFCGNRGLDFDLNLEFSSPPHTEDSDCPSAAGGGTDSANVSMAEKSSVGECDPKEEVENLNGFDSSRNKDEGDESAVVIEERGTESSEVINPIAQSSEIDNNGVSEDNAIEAREPNNNPPPELSDHDCLHLLIEAAKLISGEFADDEPEPEKPNQIDAETSTAKQTKRGHCWAVDFYGDIDDISPVVRSKRGRSQVLPYRYRDSVLEPLTRLSGQRSTSSSAKRRSR